MAKNKRGGLLGIDHSVLIEIKMTLKIFAIVIKKEGMAAVVV